MIWRFWEILKSTSLIIPLVIKMLADAGKTLFSLIFAVDFKNPENHDKSF